MVHWFCERSVSTVLERIVAAHRQRAATDERPLDALVDAARAAPPPRPFTAVLVEPGLSVVAEIKRRSPSKGELARFSALAGDLRMAVLVEVHDEGELDRALAAGADLVGVNQRDLRSFDVDRERAERLAARIPPGVVKVAESGIGGPSDAAALSGAGYDAVLVGESLVTSPDPVAAVRALKGAP